MTCESVRDQIDAFIAGTLPVADRAALEAHLATCPACAEDLQAARTLRPLTLGLASSIEPPHDLWPAVATRLRPRSDAEDAGIRPIGIRSDGIRGKGIRPRMAALLAAAAVVLVVGSSVITMAVVRGRDGGRAVEASAPGIEAGYVSASASLLRAIESEKSGLSPETIATLERNLGVIDAAIAESKAALAGDPGNRALSALLWASYRQKVSLLQQVNRLVERS
ncbi:MAG: zf-HC2 domain-containing protein [Gemmatimonadales bacterium]|nr:zf-HC2 domain-containing protein [Gemmatimonadales bacterium]